MNKIRFLLLLSGAFLYLNLRAQNRPTQSPNIIPPSPEAQAFQKYGEYEVDHSTGVPKIDIPIYEVRSGKLTLPISLSYHSSGIKINDIATNVGLGWTLKAGGMVSRSVKSLPDETGTYSFFNIAHKTKADVDAATQDANLYSYLNLTSLGTYDGESDNYFYSAAEKISGQFVYDVTNTMVPLSYTENIIKRNLSNNTFEIVGDNGTDYQFTQPENQQASGLTATYTSSWYLTKMISYDKTDTINFEYTSVNTGNSDTYLSFSKEQITTGTWTNLQANRTSVTYNNTVLLNKIRFKNGYIQFDYTDGRLDRRPYKLAAISIYSNRIDNNVLLLKKYNFSYSYFNSGGTDSYNNRLRLDQINVTDQSQQAVNSYAFSYNSTQLPAYFNPNDQNYIIGSYQGWLSMDYWGYYNGAQNTNLIPSLPAANSSNYSGVAPANRNANENYMKACVLEKITYPTGGNTIFAYEANRDNSNNLIGGLRIKTIISKADAVAAPEVKTYTYNAATVLNLIAYPASYQYYQQHETGIASGNDIPTATRDDRTIYFGSYPWPMAEHNGSSIFYTSVSEFADGSSPQTLKTDYTYDLENDRVYTVNCPRLDNTYYADRSWARGNLINVDYYKYQNASFKKLKTIGYQYTPLKTNTINTGLKAYNVWVAENLPPNYFLYSETRNLFYYFDAQIDVGIKKLQNKYSIEYDDNEAVTLNASSQYQYTSSSHLYPTQDVSTDSKGFTTTKTMQYAPDVTLSGDAETARQQLVLLNNISPVLSQTTQKGNAVFTQTTLYKLYNGYAYPNFLTQQYGSGPSITQFTNTTYDLSGNLAEFKTLNGPQVSYQWGYNGQYPIAECKNCATNEYYYQGFENAVNSSTIITGAAHTGYKYTTSPSVTFAVPNTKVYLITYWYRSGGNWLYSGDKVYTPTNNIYQLSGGDAYDDIRVYPKDAQITTYTYNPLIGLTSVLDHKGEATYYEYDGFQRLYRVKDRNGNIMKQYCYNYAGQTTDCTIPLIQPDPPATTTPVTCGKGTTNINGVCVTGTKVYDTSTSIAGGRYNCTYHYEFPNGTKSQEYTETNSQPCAL